MSLINQMLQDLEKRRASGNERGALPSQVRVLPPAQRPSTHWWLLGLGAAAVLIAALAWQLNNRPAPPAPLAAVPPAPLAAAPPAPLAAVPPAPLAAQIPLVSASPVEAPPTPSPASKLAPDPAPPPTAGEPSSPTAQEAAPKTAKSPEKTPRAAAAAVQHLASKPQPSLAASVIAAEPKAEVSKVAAAANETVTVMKAVPVAPAAPQAPVPVVSAQPATPVVLTSTPQAAPSAKPAASPSSPPPTARPVEDAKARTALANPQIDKRSQQLTAQQLAENEYREGANLLNQGRVVEAQEGFRLALQHYPPHVGARQGLFGVLMEAKKNGEAEQVLQDGLKLNSNQPGFAMALARLQVDRGDTVGAVETLQKTAPSALNSPDYLAFLAALMQRQSRHQEAIDHYQAALRLAPQSGVWLMGMGISLQAVNRNAEAQEVFRRAKASNSLNSELQAFVDQRLRQLQ